MFWLRYQPDIWRYYAWNGTIRTLPVPCFWCTIPSTVFMPRLSHSICSIVTSPCPWAGQEDHGAEEEERQQCREAEAVPGRGALCHPPPPVATWHRWSKGKMWSHKPLSRTQHQSCNVFNTWCLTQRYTEMFEHDQWHSNSLQSGDTRSEGVLLNWITNTTHPDPAVLHLKIPVNNEHQEQRIFCVKATMKQKPYLLRCVSLRDWFSALLLSAFFCFLFFLYLSEERPGEQALLDS